ncbi:MAG: hypothetical protein CME32_31685 [Gimesia sp.]|uniref:Double zinc ribbon n=1 Tax=Gimesia chilikensis TaxID=2605989 RepID=A0A517PKI3_9PLAN|nr:hypothetical protein [Gimesia chilikensis]MBN73842.1 hypothetical protein [Gimesia sp.]QDT19887.1 hypothetical protein HG66A1_16550 [Gimesia chilikensis]
MQKGKDLIDEIEVSVDELLDSPELEGLRSKLAELGKRIGKKYSIDLNCTLEVGEWENDRFLQLIDTGHSVGQNGELYRTWNVASFQRYIVNGEILIVPHDHCPSCWGEWAFEFENHSCPECGIEMGKDCKILLDSDICPHCEKGKISMTDTKCDQCGFSIDPRFVVWG